MAASIIHLNIADFAVAVERYRDPGLKNRPVVVAPTNASRAVVCDMSEEAYKMGVRKGMPLKRALERAPGARVLPPDYIGYEKAMQDLVKRAAAYTPLVAAGRADGHLFLDVSGTARLFGPARDVANRLRKEMKKELSFIPVWAVAANRLVAKVATRVVKPLGEYIVQAGDEQGFLAPLPVKLIPGINTPDVRLLSGFNLRTVSEVRSLTVDQLRVPFEDRAQFIYAAVRGEESGSFPVIALPAQKIAARHTFSADTNSREDLVRGLHRVVTGVCSDLRRQCMAAGKIRITLSYSDGLDTVSRTNIKPPASNDFFVFRKAVLLLDKAWKRRVRVRHMALECMTTLPAERQRPLLSSRSDKAERYGDLVPAMDRIRARFGKDAVRQGASLPA